MCGETEQASPINWRLYHLLELEQPVTAKQVQWTFRKVTLRHHFYQAFLVLSNAGCKNLYDALGEDVLGFINSGGWGPLISLFGSMLTIISYFVVTFLIISALCFFFVFWGLSGDGYISWPWIYIGAPLCFCVVLMVIVTFVAAVVSLFWRSSSGESLHCIERAPAVCNFITATGYAVFTFLIVISLSKDGTYTGKKASFYCFIPMVADFVYYLGSLVWRWPVSVRLQMEYGLNHPNACLCFGFFVLAIVYGILSAVQWFLIGNKLDRKTNISWYVVYVPLALRGLFRVVEAFMRSMVKHTIRTRTVIGVIFDTLGAFFFNGLWVVSLYFILVHLTRGKEAVPLLFALIPIFAILLYLLFAMIFTFVYLLNHNARSEREERLNNLKWTPKELQTDEQSGPLLFRNVSVDNEAAEWDAIDDDWSSVPSQKNGERESDYYDDIDSGEEEEIFKIPPGSQHAKTPYGTSFPPDIGVRRYSGSKTPSVPELQEKAAVEPPRQRGDVLKKQRSSLLTSSSHKHRDPYDFFKNTTAPFTNRGSPESDYSDDEYRYDGGGGYNGLGGVNHFDDDDGPLVDDMSSSASSSPVFTESLHSPRR